MKAALLALALVMSAPVATLAHAGQQLPELCYETVNGGEFCTTDNLGNIQVFIYSAGWCPPCNAEMRELAPAYQEFAGEPVTFASLSAEGWARRSQPDQAFLRAWQQKHNIPFVVAGKFRDFGQNFNSPGFIPFAVIVDPDGNVAKSGNLSAHQILSEVRRLLASR